MIFGCQVVPMPKVSIRIFLSSTTGSGNLNNLKGGPYYILQPGSALFLLICSAAEKLFLYSINCEVSICSFYMQFQSKRLLLVFSPSFFILSHIMKIVNNSVARLVINLRLYKSAEDKNAEQKNAEWKNANLPQI